MGTKATSFICRKVSGYVQDMFTRAVRGLDKACDAVVSLSREFCEKAITGWKDVAREAALLEEGLTHIAEADADTRISLRRDVANCAVETSLTLAEGVEPEITALFAAVETGEKLANAKPEKFSLREAAVDFAISVTSSAVAAANAATHIISDLEKSGREWEARSHSRPHFI